MHYGRDGNNKELSLKHPECTSGQTLKKSTVKHSEHISGGGKKEEKEVKASWFVPQT